MLKIASEIVITAGEGAEPFSDRRMPVEQVMRVFVHKPGFLLNRIDQISNALYGELSEGGETLAQAEMLLVVAAKPGSDQVGLARACGIDTSTTAIILDNLEAGGLIARAHDERDRRRSLPELTTRGLERLPSVKASFAALQTELFEPLPPAQVAPLTDRLLRLVGASNDSAPRWDLAESPLAASPSMLFRRALQISHARYNAAVAPISVTLRQFSALVIIDLQPGLSQVEFARIYGLDPSTCAIVLKKLASRGLLRTIPSEKDRRKTLYFTTDEGRELITVLQVYAEKSDQQVLDDLSTQSFQPLLPPLQAIVRYHSPRLRYPGCLPWDDVLPLNPID